MALSLEKPGATPHPVAQMPNVVSMAQWAVASDGIYFTPSSAPRSISFFNFATGKAREIFKADRDLADGIALSPDRRYLLYSQLDENTTNIMLVSNFH